MHCRNGREYRVPELPNFIMDGYCPENNTIYEFFACFWHGHTFTRYSLPQLRCWGGGHSARYCPPGHGRGLVGICDDHYPTQGGVGT